MFASQRLCLAKTLSRICSTMAGVITSSRNAASVFSSLKTRS
jgi:hypothetical protein